MKCCGLKWFEKFNWDFVIVIDVIYSGDFGVICMFDMLWLDSLVREKVLCCWVYLFVNNVSVFV